MSKYIDTEKMIAFLEKEKAEHIIGGDYSDGVLDTCDNTLAFIDSLQQEQPEVDLVIEIEDYLSSSEDIEECADNEHYYVTKSALLGMARHLWNKWYKAGKED